MEKSLEVAENKSDRSDKKGQKSIKIDQRKNFMAIIDVISGTFEFLYD